jgi:hypothetical protein
MIDALAQLFAFIDHKQSKDMAYSFIISDLN